MLENMQLGLERHGGLQAGAFIPLPGGEADEQEHNIVGAAAVHDLGEGEVQDDGAEHGLEQIPKITEIVLPALRLDARERAVKDDVAVAGKIYDGGRHGLAVAEKVSA